MVTEIPPAGTYLDFRTAEETVGRALLQHFALAFQSALSYADEAALAAAASKNFDVTDDAAPALAQVGGGIWAWQRYATEGLRPNDVPATDPGRWVRQVLPDPTRCGTTRYYQHVEYCDARTPVFAAAKNATSLWTRCRGQTPALFVSPAGDRLEEASQTLAYYRHSLNFTLRVLSANWRGGVQAQMTPGRSEDAAADPGTYHAIGDLRDYLVKNNRLSVPRWVLKTQLGAKRVVQDRGPNRIYCDALDITVICAVYTLALGCELRKPFELWLQLQDVLGANVGEPNYMGASS